MFFVTSLDTLDIIGAILLVKLFYALLAVL